MVSFFRRLIDRSVAAYEVRKASPTPLERKPYHALIDASTRVVLVVSTDPAAVSLVNETMMDTYHILNVAKPNYTGGLPFSLSEKTFAHWAWDQKERTFNRTRPDVLTQNLLRQSRLAVRKARAASHIAARLSVARSRHTPSIAMQETVYATKKAQAYAFRASGYDDTEILQYPYVLQFADFARLPYREAADDIILKAKLDDDFLAKTELLRLTYYDRLKKIENHADIPELLEAFNRDAFANAVV